MKNIKKIILICVALLTTVGLTICTNAAGATKIIKGKNITGLDELAMMPEEKFNCTVATKNGNTYKNAWSNYYITCNNGRSGFDYYDVNDKDSKYDFALVFNDDSRLAIYYTKLTRDLGVVANNFAKSTGSGNGTIEDKIFAGNVFKHVLVAEPDPYGMNYHEYYLRQVDADKLMVVDAYYALPTDQAGQALMTMAPLAVQ